MRALVAMLLILHGMAHAGAGMWSTGPLWLVTIAWCIATASFMAAGFGLIGVPLFRAGVRKLVTRGAVASVVLLAFVPHALVLPGIALDTMFAAMVSAWQGVDTPRDDMRMPMTGKGKLAFGLAVFGLIYTSCVILVRPWSMRMGTTANDRSVPLFGDSLAPDARYIVNNAITVHAPADSVWPWVAQIGQDRAGFYSYSVLENLFGAEIKNADSLVPAWQHRRVGGLVRAVPRDYLAGHLGSDVGWRIIAMDSGRALVLENWGAFVVRPIDARTAKVQIRQRSPGRATVAGFLMAPAGLLVFEPAHFIMQRGMLRGIRQRAERGA